MVGLQGWWNLVPCPQGDALGMEPCVDQPPQSGFLHTFWEGMGLSAVGGRCWCSHSASVARISVLGFFINPQLPESEDSVSLIQSPASSQACAMVGQPSGVGSTQREGFSKVF